MLWEEYQGEPDYIYPYISGDGKERARAPDSVLRVVWGGAFNFDDSSTRCATRFGFDASEGYWDAGF